MARLPYYIGVLAEALTRQGRLEEGEARIEEALDLASKQNENWSLPELLRIQVFVLAARGRPRAQEATLLKSMALAEKRGATSWRLRAGIDLARLWQRESRALEAKSMLQPLFDTFTEGLETRDPATAAKLLADLELALQ